MRAKLLTAFDYLLRIFLMLLFFVVGVCGFAFFAKADTPKPGLDLLAIKHRLWNCNATLQYFKEGDALGYLADNTFGDSDQCIRLVAETRSPSVIRAHGLDTTAVRNGKTTQFAPLFRYTINQVNKEAIVANSQLHIKLDFEVRRLKDVLNNWISQPQNKTLYISPLLEHDMPRDIAVRFHQIFSATVSKYFINLPNLTVQIVDNPVNPYAQIQGTILEKHYKDRQGNPVAEITSHDGVNFEDTDVEDGKTKASKVWFAWTQSYNCRAKIEKCDPRTKKCTPVWVNPRDRKWCASPDQIALGVRVSYPQQPRPENNKFGGLCSSVRFADGRRGEVWKISSDDHGKGDKKDGKPIFITRTNVPELGIWVNGRQKIGFMRRFGSFTGGGYRYYLGNSSGQSAFRLGQEAEIFDRSEWVVITHGKTNQPKECVLVNAYRRSGTFR